MSKNPLSPPFPLNTVPRIAIQAGHIFLFASGVFFFSLNNMAACHQNYSVHTTGPREQIFSTLFEATHLEQKKRCCCQFPATKITCLAITKVEINVGSSKVDVSTDNSPRGKTESVLNMLQQHHKNCSEMHWMFQADEFKLRRGMYTHFFYIKTNYDVFQHQ